MLCKKCSTEMFKDSYAEQDEDGDVTVKLVFKCPNPQCTAYGYKKAAENSTQGQPEINQTETGNFT